MIQYLIKNADFSKLLRFASPNLLRVVSPKVIISVAHRINKNHKDQAAWKILLQSYTSAIAHSPTKSSPESVGARVLTLFFHQILTRSTWILDFRSEAFKVATPTTVIWQPQPYYYEITPTFLAGIRNLYRGFYTANDRLFDQALAELGLTPARASLRNHFGVGNQSQVRFQLRTFQSTFTEVFETCAKEGVKLQPDFFVLGIILLGLYENLETLNVPLDVRSCFDQAIKLAERSE